MDTAPSLMIVYRAAVTLQLLGAAPKPPSERTAARRRAASEEPWDKAEIRIINAAGSLGLSMANVNVILGLVETRVVRR